MRKATLTNKGFQINDVPLPRIGKNEILVKTSLCGICEGDVFNYKQIKERGLGGNVDEETGLSIGHENSGIIEDLGDNISNFKVGDRVTALDGDYAEYWVTNPEMLFKIPEKTQMKKALGEPIACCVHAAKRFGIELGDKIAILGTGFMGIVSLQLARIQGASFILATDMYDWRLKTARQLGADETENAEVDAETIIKKYGEFDVVIEAAGVPGVIDTATKIVRKHGRIILVGYHQSDLGERTVDMKTWNFKALDIINGHVRNNVEKLKSMKDGITLLDKGILNIDDLITYYNFNEINSAFNELTRRRKGLYKASLVF